MTSGSKEWFSKRVKELRRDFRALDSVTLSIEYVTALIRLWGDGDITITSALHNMAVISYARTFTKQKRLDKGFDISVGDFEDEPLFDGVMHKHLMSIRDQIIAHSDASKLPCRVGFGHGSFDELGASFVLASEARIVSLLGTDDIEVIQRYLVHFEACEGLLDKRAETGLAELLAAAVDFPENIPGERGSAQTARVTLENRRLNMMVPVADFFSRHAAPTPRLIIGDDGYVYRQLVKLVRRKGKFVLQTKQGPVLMELATEPIKPNAAAC